MTLSEHHIAATTATPALPCPALLLTLPPRLPSTNVTLPQASATRCVPPWPPPWWRSTGWRTSGTPLPSVSGRCLCSATAASWQRAAAVVCVLAMANFFYLPPGGSVWQQPPAMVPHVHLPPSILPSRPAGASKEAAVLAALRLLRCAMERDVELVTALRQATHAGGPVPGMPELLAGSGVLVPRATCAGLPCVTRSCGGRVAHGPAAGPATHAPARPCVCTPACTCPDSQRQSLVPSTNW